MSPFPVEAPRRPSVSRELVSVRGRIGAAVRDFCRLWLGRPWYASHLRAYVEEQCGPVAPDSPARILRELRRDGVVAFNANRGTGIYVVTAVTP